MTKKPLVSIVIPTKNAEEYLARTLKSVKRQTYKDTEIIIVDNYSKDNTIKIAKKFTKKIYIHGNERGAQTNYGMQKAKGEYLYRIDGDFLLDPKIIEQAVNKCQKDNLDGIAIHNTSLPDISFWAKVRKLERDSYENDDLIVGVRFYTRKAWRKIGGYNEDVVWDDYDFHNRFIKYGFRWGRIKAKEYHLGEPKTLGDVFWKNYYYGQEMLTYLKKNPSRGARQINPMRISYIIHWKNFIKQPLLTSAFIIMIFVKYFAGFLGIIKRLITDFSKKL